MSQRSLPGVQVAPVWDPDEKTFQRHVIDAAHHTGWIVAHFHPLRTAHGWKTPASADGAGWPDLVLVGRGQILFRELKTNKGRPTVDQKAWLDRFDENGGDSAIWRPRDLRDVVLPELGATVVS